jgi:VanZ family protein
MAAQPLYTRHTIEPRETVIAGIRTLALLAVLGGIFVVSIAPFRFAPLTADHLQRLGHLGFPHSSARDIAMNVLGYMPVGAVLAWALASKWRRGPVIPILAATLAGSCLSFCLESLQTLLPGRCASWIDVSMNTVGSALGALALTWVAWPARFERKRPRPAFGWRVTARAAMVVVLLMADAPLSLERIARELGRDLRHPAIPALIAEVAHTIAEWLHQMVVLLAMVSSDVLLAMAFAALGWAVTRAQWEARGASGNGLRRALLQCLAVAACAEGLQVFTAMHHFDWLDLLRNIATSCGGALAASAWIHVTAPRSATVVGEPAGATPSLDV